MQKIAIIGLGAMGKNHYNTLKNFKDVNIVGLCDVAQKEDFEEPFFTDFEQMLIETKPDAVIIVTPTFLHKKYALICTKYNVHMLIEKPAASSVEDAKEISAAIKAKNLKSCVGYIERFNPVVKALINANLYCEYERVLVCEMVVYR